MSNDFLDNQGFQPYHGLPHPELSGQDPAARTGSFGKELAKVAIALGAFSGFGAIVVFGIGRITENQNAKALKPVVRCAVYEAGAPIVDSVIANEALIGCFDQVFGEVDPTTEQITLARQMLEEEITIVPVSEGPAPIEN